jgi:hypothetical protein
VLEQRSKSKETFEQSNRVTFHIDTRYLRHANLRTFQLPSAREIYEQISAPTLLQVPSPLNIPSDLS